MSYQEAVDLANRLSLAAVVETSSRKETEMDNEDPDIHSEQGYSDYYDNVKYKPVHDCFTICACKSVDESKR